MLPLILFQIFSTNPSAALQDFSKLVETGAYLQEVFLQEDTSQIRRDLKLARGRLARLLPKVSQIPHPQKKEHISKKLQAILSRVGNLSEGAPVDKLSKKLIFKDFIEVIRVYKLLAKETKYKVFYCKKDSSSWLQKAGSPIRNPIGLDYKKCGKEVRL